MLSADVLIINNKGEINEFYTNKDKEMENIIMKPFDEWKQMINTLKMCCITFDLMK